MNVHEGFARYRAHRAAVAAMLTAEPPPLPALYRSHPADPTKIDTRQPNPVAQFLDINGRCYLRVHTDIPLTAIPELVRWLCNIQAHIPAPQADPSPPTDDQDPQNPDYNPYQGAD